MVGQKTFMPASAKSCMTTSISPWPICRWQSFWQSSTAVLEDPRLGTNSPGCNLSRSRLYWGRNLAFGLYRLCPPEPDPVGRSRARHLEIFFCQLNGPRNCPVCKPAVPLRGGGMNCNRFILGLEKRLGTGRPYGDSGTVAPGHYANVDPAVTG